MPNLKISNREDIELFTNYCMMSLVKNGMTDYILDGFETLMSENDMYGYYLSDLILFYKSHLIPSLDMDKIYKIVSYLETDPLEKQRFIFYLFNRKMHRDMLFNNLANRGNINMLFFLSDKVEDPT